MNSPFSLEFKRRFSAPIEKVFEAWTQPEKFKQWFGPKGTTLKSLKLNAVVGGKYEIHLEIDDGDSVFHFGEYLEVTSPLRLVFSWILANQPCDGSKNQDAETIVRINFKKIGDETELHLLHDKLPNKAARDGHNKGWTGCLENLELLLAED